MSQDSFAGGLILNLLDNRFRRMWGVLLLGCIVLSAIGIAVYARRRESPIRVGILHSETGTMGISERSVRDATLLAIEQINANGGLLGRTIEPIVIDGESDPQVFAIAAEQLINEHQVQVIFGCWTSATRKTVRPIIERHDHLMFYPVQYEGLEQSPNIVYTGAAPNQQILPAVKWCHDALGARSFYLVGSDYVFPRTAAAIVHAQIAALGGNIVGEDYLPLGNPRLATERLDEVVHKIADAHPDVILNTINGDGNIAFFAALRQAGITPAQIPTVSFSIAEDELRSMDRDAMAGDYAAWNYFQSISRPENQLFVKQFQQKYGSDRVTDDPIEAGYFGVFLWAQAVEDAGSTAPTDVRRTLPNQSFPAPQGIVSIDPENQHTWKTVRIGRIRPDGQFTIVWTSDHPVRPVPYPIYRSREQWDGFLEELYLGWDRQWSNPR